MVKIICSHNRESMSENVFDITKFQMFWEGIIQTWKMMKNLVVFILIVINNTMNAPKQILDFTASIY